jgi:hypothetical protein
VAWLLTLGVWWQGRAGRRRRHDRPGEDQGGATARGALRRLGVAGRNGDAGAARDALLDWAREKWPEAPPRSVGEVAERLPPALAAPVQQLSSALYGPSAGSWSGASLAACVDEFRRLPSRPGVESRSALPPLWPERGA